MAGLSFSSLGPFFKYAQMKTGGNFPEANKKPFFCTAASGSTSNCLESQMKVFFGIVEFRSTAMIWTGLVMRQTIRAACSKSLQVIEDKHH